MLAEAKAGPKPEAEEDLEFRFRHRRHWAFTSCLQERLEMYNGTRCSMISNRPEGYPTSCRVKNVSCQSIDIPH
jgi:hypothetical protein